MRLTCRHCGARGANRPRGLCWRCYYSPGVRDGHPSGNAGATRGREPTEEELEAMIAEQMANLPPWWDEPDPDDG